MLIKHALKHPKTEYYIQVYQKLNGVTYQIARTDLLGLAELKLMHKKKRGKAFIFIAPDDLKKRITRHHTSANNAG